MIEVITATAEVFCCSASSRLEAGGPEGVTSGGE